MPREEACKSRVPQQSRALAESGDLQREGAWQTGKGLGREKRLIREWELRKQKGPITKKGLAERRDSVG